ncbi:hypothetical protein [Nocardia seriolae]|uniref:Uncharacterized protein n=2 Tax=Nocardia seriolae TaxID=37332 RepID=A0ABC9Z1Z0_9NOCA|nr:hypothetical protein [Nocardia seriolae]GEM27505.1 hypothetical protein NS2_57440 [Nocardia seriolae NBRC 15557]APA95997.1 hypothetical protein NS506_01930 [Nocardia seriolae]OJF82610.1 hypothetical protein NS14008_30095 [Nocardia seriolae]PSK27508.1 hypothetical protein C6575_31440 [Nocardia seriolae]QUN20889.1 hypothetical protein KEC46_17595 [Nocardia seriolae]
MGQRIPAVVGLYLREAGRWRRIAEFRLAADGHATFRAVDPVEGLVARVWYHQGVDILGENRTVLPADGAAFLRALLQPFGFRDYRFRDDSSPRGSLARTGHMVSRTFPVVTPDGNESDWAAGDSECHRCAEVESARADATHRPPARPAGWRLLDADTVQF